MRVFLNGLAFCLAMAVATAVQAGTLPIGGPNPKWDESQKFEWYLGYMSKAVAICGDFSASTQLGEIAALSPYGRVGLKGFSADGFYGGVCVRIRARAKELLEKKEAYVRFLTDAYDCGPGGKCSDGSDLLASDHACSEKVDEALYGFGIIKDEITSIRIDSKIPGPSNGAEPDHHARVRLKTCQGSLYLDLGAQCSVKQSYTRGDCQVAGVSAY